MTELFRAVAEGPESSALTRGLWARRAVMTALAAFVALALAGLFGQHGTTSRADTPVVTMKLGLPEAVRGGLMFQAKLQLVVHQDIEHPRLVLGTGWTEGLQVNTIEPSAMGESSRDGHLVLTYDTFAAGDRPTIWFQWQVDPTEFGRRDFALELDDAEKPIARIKRTMTVFP